MMADDILRLVILGALVFVVLLWAVTALLSPVAGIWQDDDKIIKLVQMGPRLKGLCKHGDGFQTFNGWIFFGRIYLKRRDFGEERLIDMGFEKVTLPLVNGQIMAYLSFRLNLEQTHLEGTFSGCRYTFSPNKQQILSISKSAPTKRVWQRQA